MTSDPIKLFEQMFTIIGHDERESKSLAKDLYGTIMQQAVFTILPELSESHKSKLNELVSQGKQPEEVWNVLLGSLNPELAKRHTTVSSFSLVQQYLKEITPRLTQTQKEQLYNLFIQIN